MTAITLILPYPISANRYWQTTAIRGRAMTYVSKEAKAYKADVARCCRLSGLLVPIAGRVAIHAELFPAMPQDWERRKRRDGVNWDDTVRCIDLDNANKVMLDALKGIAIDDDKWVRRLSSERMTPDSKGARLVVTITPLQAEQQEQIALPMTAPDLAAGVARHREQQAMF
jgi:crossover junction endodeoxyribonuclease RusA